MIGFYIDNGKCIVIPELSLYDKTHDLHELLNNIPYSQKKCSFCLNDFIKNIEVKKIYNKDNKDKQGLNMDWFKSRIIILNCHHIFHLCCFTKYIKYNYTEYMFSNINNTSDHEYNSSISSSLNNGSNSNSSKYNKSEGINYSNLNILSNIKCYNISETDSVIDSINSYEKKISNKNLSDKSYDSALCDIKKYYEYLENLINKTDKDENNNKKDETDKLNVIDDEKEDNYENEFKSYYETETSISTNNTNCFKINCPLCKKKVNSSSTSSILDKYKILLELYS